MPQYSTISIKDTIGRIIRNTRVQDTSFISDMPVWIAEAMEQMKTRYTKVTKWIDVDIYFHKGALPCGLDYIRSVEYKGCRIESIDISRAMDSPTYIKQNNDVMNPTPFLTILTEQQIITEGIEARTSDSTAVPLLSTLSADECDNLPAYNAYYFAEMGYINTSFANGKVRIHYKSIPLDDEELPVIPDNENYKQALYWYCRGMMIGAGYEDKVYNPQYCDAKFEMFSNRAIGEISYPAVDEMESRVRSHTRLLPDMDYFSNYFTSDSEPLYE